MDYAVGGDIGGTHIRLAIVSSDGTILERAKHVVGEKRDSQEIITKLASLISSLIQKSPVHSISRIGLGVPGIVSSSKGIVYASPYYPEWKDFAFAVLLSKELSIPVCVDNDAHMVAQGELWEGAVQDWPTFLMITLGTGIGGALVIESNVFQGNEGFAGEIGHTVLQTEGQPCACGSQGCFETLVSAKALRRMVQDELSSDELPGADQLGKLLTGDEAKFVEGLAHLARNGNLTAKTVFEEMGYYLGIGIASLVNVTGLQKILLGGGISHAHDLFLDRAQEELRKRTYKRTAQGVEIRLARLGDDGGILGAAQMAFGGVVSR